MTLSHIYDFYTAAHIYDRGIRWCVAKDVMECDLSIDHSPLHVSLCEGGEAGKKLIWGNLFAFQGDMTEEEFVAVL